MIVSKTPILLVHLLGPCLAVGPVRLRDARPSRPLSGRPVDRIDVALAAFLKPWIRSGLVLLRASGASFLAIDALTDLGPGNRLPHPLSLDHEIAAR